MSSEADQLVERIRERDADALAQFITLRQRQLMAYIDRQLGPGLRSKLEPDDVFQEMSADAVRSLPQVKLEDRDPFGWLCQIAERRIIDAHRRFFGTQKRAAAREVSLGSPSGNSSRAALIDLLVMTMTTASQAFSRDQREIRILDALNSLRDDQREALRLRYMEGLPSKEIAQRLGKTDGAVRVMLSRSLNRLQEILGPEVAP